MTKKAIVVAVGKYQPYASDLAAPVFEMKQWEELLHSDKYAFDDVTLLPDEKATRSEVLKAIGELLEGAQPNDQLMFFFGGHGTIARGWETETTLADTIEESLVVYPNADQDLQNAVITESDMRRLFIKHAPPIGTDITFVLDCCLAGGYDPISHKLSAFRSGENVDAIPLLAPFPVQIDAFPRKVAKFGHLIRLHREHPQIEKPLIVAAARRSQFAWQIRDDGEYRLLFSSRALSRLREKPERYAELIDNVDPLSSRIPQTPVLSGNTERENEYFGGAEPPAPKLQRPEPPVPAETPAPQNVDNTRTISLRVIGLCCFVNALPSGAAYKNRLVMPYDDYGQNAQHHLAFIEIARRDMISISVGAPPTKTYFRGPAEFWRWELDRHHVGITNGDTTAPFDRSNAFHLHVPSMPDLASELRDYPRGACFDPRPVTDKLFAAFLDIPGGGATTGALENVPTILKRPISGQETWGPQFTPRNVLVTVPVVDDYATIALTHEDPARSAEIRVRLGSTVFTGNAREEDITGNGSGTNDPEQFRVYYKLSHFVPTDPPLPIVPAVPIDACSVTSWP